MAGERFTLYAVKLGTTVLAGTSRQTYQANGETLVPVTDGGPDPTVAALTKLAPAVEFTTHDLEGALNVLGLLGKDIADLTGGVVLYFRKAGRIGAASGSVHTTYTATAGVVVPTRLSAPHEGQAASLTFRVQAVSSDGTTAPWTKATSAALGAVSAALDKIFRAGKVGLNGGALLDGIKGIEIDFGQKVEVDSDSGYAYPTAAYTSERKAKATISHTNVALAVPTSLSAVVLFLRALTNGGFPYADASEEHLKITIAAGVFEEGEIGAGPGAECSFMVNVRKTGSTDPLQYTADQAMS